MRFRLDELQSRTPRSVVPTKPSSGLYRAVNSGVNEWIGETRDSHENRKLSIGKGLRFDLFGPPVPGVTSLAPVGTWQPDKNRQLFLRN